MNERVLLRADRIAEAISCGSPALRRHLCRHMHAGAWVPEDLILLTQRQTRECRPVRGISSPFTRSDPTWSMEWANLYLASPVKTRPLWGGMYTECVCEQ